LVWRLEQHWGRVAIYAWLGVITSSAVFGPAAGK
jgi:hypothetical protein